MRKRKGTGRGRRQSKKPSAHKKTKSQPQAEEQHSILSVKRSLQAGSSKSSNLKKSERLTLGLEKLIKRKESKRSQVRQKKRLQQKDLEQSLPSQIGTKPSPRRIFTVAFQRFSERTKVLQTAYSLGFASILLGLIAFSTTHLEEHTNRASYEHYRKPPGLIANLFDSIWKEICLRLMQDIRDERDKLFRTILEEKNKFGIELEVPRPKEIDTSIRTRYGQLPEVLVDRGHGAIFPMPLGSPHEFSWFQNVKKAFELRRLVRQVLVRTTWITQSSGDTRERLFENTVSRWHMINSGYARIAHHARYLNMWIPELKRYYRAYGKKGKLPPGHRLLNAILNGDPKKMVELREHFRPKRDQSLVYLPKSLDKYRGKVIPVRIYTDISDKNFIAEVEGAIESFWNQSPWSEKERVDFKIEWIKVPENKEFKESRQSLIEHLGTFPENYPAITTGGLSTHVRGNILVFGLGKIRPRSIAHEFGHLLGFPDCYIRTIGGHGIFGKVVLEWSNPIYPDDLMCDNSLGIGRAEVW